MAPSHRNNVPRPLQTTSHESTGLRQRLVDLLHCFRKENAHKFATKMMFLILFLVNNIILTCLFVWINLKYTEQISHEVSESCLGTFEYPYQMTYHSAVAYFSLLSLLIIALIMFMQLKQFKIPSQIYFIISLLSAATFLFSAGLVLVAAFGILFEDEQCKASDRLSITKIRFVFETTAAFMTSLLFLGSGVSLNAKSRYGVSPEVPATPIYQIHPPSFSTLYPPPPPTYQQSQREHRRNLSQGAA
ncbi:unnamed protein product [Bursaphelenchus okinawaensis]|uniref:Uncharacterized protein n=1 Tax=Bursaphelenchus okinawaensis TaxID=465554 RepID=A0A811L2Q2_9BILA|nr:unnamed protein product [Bursaphelenchus okinawaensis]CAG9115518.1 unnamed protein product [Bursaphelenchus okinawaensis]